MPCELWFILSHVLDTNFYLLYIDSLFYEKHVNEVIKSEKRKKVLSLSERNELTFLVQTPLTYRIIEISTDVMCATFVTP